VLAWGRVRHGGGRAQASFFSCVKGSIDKTALKSFKSAGADRNYTHPRRHARCVIADKARGSFIDKAFHARWRGRIEARASCTAPGWSPGRHGMGDRVRRLLKVLAAGSGAKRPRACIKASCSRMSSLRTGDAFAGGVRVGLVELFGAARDDKTFEESCGTSKSLAMDGGHLVTQRRKMLDSPCYYR